MPTLTDLDNHTSRETPPDWIGTMVPYISALSVLPTQDGSYVLTALVTPGHGLELVYETQVGCLDRAAQLAGLLASAGATHTSAANARDVMNLLPH